MAPRRRHSGRIVSSPGLKVRTSTPTDSRPRLWLLHLLSDSYSESNSAVYYFFSIRRLFIPSSPRSSSISSSIDVLGWYCLTRKPKRRALIECRPISCCPGSGAKCRGFSPGAQIFPEGHSKSTYSLLGSVS